MSRGWKTERKPKGRTDNAVAPSREFEDGSRVEIVGSNRKQYVVDFNQMVQRSILTGNRRSVSYDAADGSWYFDATWVNTRAPGATKGTNWERYPAATQKRLTKAFQAYSAIREAEGSAVDASVCRSWMTNRSCRCGAPMVRCSNDEPWFCDGCRRHVKASSIHSVTCFQCSATPETCDFHLCGCCNAQSELSSSAAAELDQLASRIENAPSGSLSENDVVDARQAIFALGVDLEVALRALRALVERHRIAFTVDDARRAALCLGSISALQLVLQSNPDLQLQGQAIFDQRYNGLKINDERFKQCIKALLARGAYLGNSTHGFIPSSKLLRKIEADAFPAWVERYFLSLAASGVDLPDHVQDTVCNFLDVGIGCQR